MNSELIAETRYVEQPALATAGPAVAADGRLDAMYVLRARALIEQVAEAVDGGRCCDAGRDLVEETETLYDAIEQMTRSLGLVGGQLTDCRPATLQPRAPMGHGALPRERPAYRKPSNMRTDAGFGVEEVSVATNTDSGQVPEVLSLLAQLRDAFATSPDAATALARVARIPVPALADWCLVDVIGPDRSTHAIGLAHREPAGEQQLRALLDAYPAALTPFSNAKVLACGRAQHHPRISDAVLAGAAADATQVSLIRQIGLTSLMIVPLRRRDHVLGTITFASAGQRRAFGSIDLALAQALADRVALEMELDRVRQETETAVQARNQFLATVSHDLRGPLATIKTFAQVLERHVASPGALQHERVIAGLAAISGTATKMAGQLAELLDVACLQAGQPLVLERCPTDLVALARQVVEPYRAEAPKHSLQVQAQEPAIVGEWDRDRVERVIGNLVANAIKYSPRGGEVTVTVSRERDGRGNLARLDVRDQGLGIPAADLPHVFEGFRRGSNVVGRIPGTGIGLTSVRQIVQQHGGTIEISSHEGEGSTVTVWLPVAPV